MASMALSVVALTPYILMHKGAHTHKTEGMEVLKHERVRLTRELERVNTGMINNTFAQISGEKNRRKPMVWPYSDAVIF